MLCQLYFTMLELRDNGNHGTAHESYLNRGDNNNLKNGSGLKLIIDQSFRLNSRNPSTAIIPASMKSASIPKSARWS